MEIQDCGVAVFWFRGFWTFGVVLDEALELVACSASERTKRVTRVMSWWTKKRHSPLLPYIRSCRATMTTVQFRNPISSGVSDTRMVRVVIRLPRPRYQRCRGGEEGRAGGVTGRIGI